MNLLIENLNSTLLNGIDVNVIKTLHGEFTRGELDDQLVNLTYSKVIIDITAIKNRNDFDVLFDFLSYFDKSKVILFLDNSVSKECVSKLVQNGYYDFTKNVGGINYLTTHPNKMKDVEKYLIVNSFSSPIVEEKKQEFNPFGDLSTDSTPNEDKAVKNENQIVIGIQNLTPHAGATTLMYMMIKTLRNYYRVAGVEMINQDALYYRDPDISESTSYDDLKYKIKSFKDKQAVIIDLNTVNGNVLCDFVLFLVEPGIVSLSKLLNKNQSYAKIMASNARIVLNRCSLPEADIPSFEYETKLKVFHILGNIDDRSSRNKEVDELLVKLGFDKIRRGGLFGIFR